VEYLIELIKQAKENDVELEIGELWDKAKGFSEKTDINTLIFLIYQHVSNHFIEKLAKHLQERARESETIVDDYINSHLWYEDREIQLLREGSQFYM
jgi:hypothetical protein